MQAQAQAARNARVLPWLKSVQKGVNAAGLLAPTVVKPSAIAGAGNGRYAAVNIPDNTVFLRKPLVNVDTHRRSELFEDDKVILIRHMRDVFKLIKIYHSETGEAEGAVSEGLSHFVASHHPNLCHLNVTTLCANHSPKPEITTFYDLENGYLIGKTLRSIRKGEELHQNYHDFDDMPMFWTDYCESNGYNDVYSFVHTLDKL